MSTYSSIARADLEAARDKLVRPLGQAEGMPGRFYCEDFYSLEQQELFPSSWCAVSVGARLPKAGDMLPVDLAGWPIVLVRGKDMQVRAFHNVCRHRAFRLVTEATCRPNIRCPWHSWSYNLQGALVSTPEVGGPGLHDAEGIDRSDLSLKEIALGMWHDLIFVNIDGSAGSFADYIAPMKDLVGHYELGGLAHAMQVNDGYEGNWKLGMEGGLEHYHITFAHPQLGGHLYRNAETVYAPGTYTGSSTAVVAETKKADGKAWGGVLPPLLTSDGDPLPRLFSICLFPTGTVMIGGDQFMVGAILPDGPLRTRFELHVYTRPEAAEAEEFAAERAEKLDGWYTVIPQDKPFVEGAQAASATRDQAGIPIRFSPYWEDGVRRFQQMVLDRILGTSLAPAAE